MTKKHKVLKDYYGAMRVTGSLQGACPAAPTAARRNQYLVPLVKHAYFLPLVFLFHQQRQ